MHQIVHAVHLFAFTHLVFVPSIAEKLCNFLAKTELNT